MHRHIYIQILRALVQGLSTAERHEKSSPHYPRGLGKGAVPDTTGE